MHERSCPICFSDLFIRVCSFDFTYLPCCQEIICIRCLTKLIMSNCPFCRESYPPNPVELEKMYRLKRTQGSLEKRERATFGLAMTLSSSNVVESNELLESLTLEEARLIRACRILKTSASASVEPVEVKAALMKFFEVIMYDEKCENPEVHYVVGMLFGFGTDAYGITPIGIEVL